jgi:5-dehydro-4-deoxyglucarate dehydratase
MTMTASELKERLRGVIAYSITPLQPDLSLDLAGLDHNLNFLLASGVHAIAVCGSTGEFFSLAPDEHRRVVKSAVDQVGGRVPVVAGVGFSTSMACEMARYMEEVGGDGVIVFPPYFARATQEGLYAYYSEVAKSTDLGQILFSKGWALFSPDLVERLTTFPNVVAFKEEAGEFGLFGKITRRVGDRLAYITGLAEPAVPACFALGAQAFGSGISNFMPHVSLTVYDAACRGDSAELHRLICERVAPIHDLRDKPGYAIPVIKEAMNLLDMPAGPVRPPLTAITAEDRERLKEALDRVLNGDGSIRKGHS